MEQEKEKKKKKLALALALALERRTECFEKAHRCHEKPLTEDDAISIQEWFERCSSEELRSAST